MDCVDDDDQVPVVEVGCEIQAGRAEVENFDVGAAGVFATEDLYGERAEAVVAKEDIA
jgi:hypothetical protein